VSETWKNKMQKIIGSGFPIIIIIIIIIIICAVALLDGRSKMNPRYSNKTIYVFNGANSLELDVMNVNHVIARYFHLPKVSGVLINDVPQGTARKISGLKRGDIILTYNNVDIRGEKHLSYLMQKSKPGDTVSFEVWRNGKKIKTSFKVPISSAIANFYKPEVINIFVTLVILFSTFACLFFNVINRTVCVVVGATSLMILGSLLGFYDQTKAFNSIRMSPIIIFLGMSIFSLMLEKFRFFDYLAKRIIVYCKTDARKIFLGLCFATYILSLFVNNLSIILVLIPITLSVTRVLKMDPVPLVIAEIIASNLGGASTMIGDFPNMLISSATGLAFMDFLIFMTPICFILFLAQLWFFYQFNLLPPRSKKLSMGQAAFFKKIKFDLENMQLDWKTIRKILGVLALVIISYMILPEFNVKAPTIVFAGGFILLAIENKYAKDILKQVGLTDIVFFLALFILVGGAIHSGLLNYFAHSMEVVSAGNKLLYLIVMMWVVAFFTMFLNAGPSTAFFMPIILQSQFAAFSDIVWWALSLGVLAGSSATLTGATAGIVTQTLLEEKGATWGKSALSSRFTFKTYSKTGIPIALMFLIISTIYIIFLYSIR